MTQHKASAEKPAKLERKDNILDATKLDAVKVDTVKKTDDHNKPVVAAVAS